MPPATKQAGSSAGPRAPATPRSGFAIREAGWSPPAVQHRDSATARTTTSATSTADGGVRRPTRRTTTSTSRPAPRRLRARRGRRRPDQLGQTRGCMTRRTGRRLRQGDPVLPELQRHAPRRRGHRRRRHPRRRRRPGPRRRPEHDGVQPLPRLRPEWARRRSERRRARRPPRAEGLRQPVQPLPPALKSRTCKVVIPATTRGRRSTRGRVLPDQELALSGADPLDLEARHTAGLGRFVRESGAAVRRPGGGNGRQRLSASPR